MHRLLAAATLLASSLALPISTEAEYCKVPQSIELRQHGIDNETFAFACPDCFPNADANVFVGIRLQPPTCLGPDPLSCSGFIFNGQELPGQSSASEHVTSFTSNAWQYSVNYTATCLLEETGGTTHFEARAADEHAIPPGIGFRVSWYIDDQLDTDGRAVAHLGLLSLDHIDESYDFRCRRIDFIPPNMAEKNAVDEDTDDLDIGDYDIQSDIEFLRLLEQDARKLQTEIDGKKQIISVKLAQYHAHTSLDKILAKCDGIVCAAKAIATRISEHVTIATAPQGGYLKQQDGSVNEKNSSSGFGANRVAFAVNKNATASYAPSIHDYVAPQSVLFKALSLIASILGLAAICALLRRKCMSMRRRVERAADLEERRNARAYRRAARRALMRRRWDALVSAVSCFGKREEARTSDYEEKRALILQDAFLEQDLDQAEKGQIMEAEIRELRHAHEIVTSMVIRDKTRYDLVTPIKDPPPPLVPLPYTPTARSRASTGTLPSYNSEDLPDYSSTPERTEDSTVTDGFINYTPSAPRHERSRANASVPSESSRRTRSSPTSSVIGISPRVSTETIRTRLSRLSKGRSDA